MKSWTREQLLKKKIGVLAGGWSAEREVSLRTGQAALKALVARGYHAVPIDPDLRLPQQLQDAEIDVAFIALHGQGGEDGTVQGLLEVMRIPYSGSGVLSSSVAMDKIITKQLLAYHGLPTPAFDYVKSGETPRDLARRCQRLPLVVKPSQEGSTVGICIARTREELEAGLEIAARLNGTLMVEDFVDGDELTVSVVNDQVLPIIQIVPQGGFYDYQAKYASTTTRYLVPAPVAPDIAVQIQDAALRACRALGCRGAARVDFMMANNSFYCIEVNTIPGMTATSLLPKAAAAAGIGFEDLVEMILFDADLMK
ncbi:D-alanine--D-alanine ligase [Pelovirga terrestris]|uniref:D-alanine--D-alanine ligase n=1 Tax=Pelovirga terrestris TaxID=2771352 RepID=A0A8J6UNV9_9BACT|nr:D-alanine--D-alanine ligase [Pelovirga terrestris]MBD1400139.1 D-alanine--D-alanine ligase [Pelovirga terrestris]